MEDAVIGYTTDCIKIFSFSHARITAMTPNVNKTGRSNDVGRYLL